MSAPMTQGEYVAVGGGICPFCRSPHIEGGEVTITDGQAVQEVGCGDCGHEWDDVYALTGYEVT